MRNGRPYPTNIITSWCAIACEPRLLGQSPSLDTYLTEQPCEGSYTINIPAEPRIGGTATEALLIIRCVSVKIRHLERLKAQDYPPSITLYAVEAIQVNPPAGQEAIHWRLLTTHRVVCLEQALQVIEWYRWRSRIKQLFATLKQAGLNLEATKLESIAAIPRLTILALGVAVRTLQMVEGRDRADLPVSLTFSDAQQQCLSVIEPYVQGRTKKLPNPYPPASLPWATWLIARLGGWGVIVLVRPPGMPILVHGLRQFESIFLGWKLAQNQLVCTR